MVYLFNHQRILHLIHFYIIGIHSLSYIDQVMEVANQNKIPFNQILHDQKEEVILSLLFIYLFIYLFIFFFC